MSSARELKTDLNSFVTRLQRADLILVENGFAVWNEIKAVEALDKRGAANNGIRGV